MTSEWKEMRLPDYQSAHVTMLPKFNDLSEWKEMRLPDYQSAHVAML